jgi:hypothetical protein
MGDVSLNTGTNASQSIYEPRAVVDIDFTSPYLSLPNEICRTLEKALSLNWDNTSRLYLLNDTVHRDMMVNKANLTFQMYGDSSSQQFTIPYASLVLTATFPLVNQTVQYFALQRARTGAFVLGRAFLQHTYLTAVFDRPGGGYFNLSQSKWSKSTNPRIVEIKPGGMVREPSSSNLSTGAIVGIVLGGVVAIAVVLYLFWSHRTHHFPFAGTRYTQADRAELDGEEKDDAHAMKELESYHEVEGDHVAEFPGSPPPPVELPGDEGHHTTATVSSNEESTIGDKTIAKKDLS